MKAIGHVKLNAIESRDALEFNIVSEIGWFELVLALALTLFGIWIFWRVNTPVTHLFAVAICAVAVFSAVAHLVQGRSTHLRITSDEIFAEGNVNKLLSTTVRIPAREVESLGFREGDDGESSGLYVTHGWHRICVLPGLDKDQGSRVANAIFKKFPNVFSEDRSQGSLLYWTVRNLTSFGLTGPRQEKNGSNP